MLITQETLPLALDRLGVPRNVYSIGHQVDNAWCLTALDSGRWQVAYRERGTDFDVSVLNTAEDACYLLLGRLALRQITSGATVPGTT
ncbi:MAG: hypothetical protein ACREX8_18370 [Gammaproteobacteria bacterium]